MSEQNKNVMVCKNGHPQRNTVSKFCIYCGTPLQLQSFIPQNPPPPIPPQNPVQPTPPSQPNQNNQAQVYQNLPIPPKQVQLQPPPVNQVKPCGTCGGRSHLHSLQTGTLGFRFFPSPPQVPQGFT